jgi:hypothetical protein
MKTTFLQFLSVAACIAAVSPGLLAQGGAAKVRVLRTQSPGAQPPVAKQLAEVIDMLDADGMTEAQQQKAKAVLKGVVERLRHDRKQDAFGGTWSTTPEIAVVGEPEISIVEAEGDDMAPGQAPRAAVRTRVLRVDGDGDEPVVARVIRGGGWTLKNAPKAPRAPKGAGAAKGQGGAFVLRKSDEGEDVVWESIEDDVANAKQDALRAVHERMVRGEMGEAHRELQLQLGRKRDRAARRAVMSLADEVAPSAPAESVDEVDPRATATADRAIKMLVERRRAAGKQRLAEVAKIEDVTEEVEVADADADDADLRAMIDEMRAEMREVRALMQRIREQAPAGTK